MAATAGKLAVLSLLLNGVYVPLAGLKTRSITFGNTNVDVTTADSAGRWRELLPSAGVQNLDIDAAGTFQNDSAANQFQQAVQASTLQTVKFQIPNVITITGQFMSDNFKLDAPFNESLSFELKLLSSGQPTISYP